MNREKTPMNPGTSSKRGWIRRLAIVSTIGMFIVIVMGSTVTGTGSAEGCGDSWPLCHGEFIPEYAVETMIEYSHRIVSGIEGLFIVGLAVAALAVWRWRTEVKVLVPVMVAFVFIQAALGALAVMYPNSDEVLAAHFGISLTAFASVGLLTAMLFEIGRRADRLRDRPLPGIFKAYVAGIVVYIYGLFYLGAYVRHTHSSMACVDWPLCNGQVFPGFDGAIGIQFGHRLMALGGMLLMGGLVAWTWRFRQDRPDLFWASGLSFVLVLAQAISGGIVVLTRLNLFSALTHAALATLLFGALAYVVLHILPRPTVAEEPAARAGETERYASPGIPSVSSTGDVGE